MRGLHWVFTSCMLVLAVTVIRQGGSGAGSAMGKNQGRQVLRSPQRVLSPVLESRATFLVRVPAQSCPCARARLRHALPGVLLGRAPAAAAALCRRTP